MGSFKQRLRATGVVASIFMWILTLAMIAENIDQPAVMVFLFLWAFGLFISGVCVGDTLSSGRQPLDGETERVLSRLFDEEGRS
jgi:hypothetical protein